MTIGEKHRVHLKDMFILSLSCGEQKCVYNATQAAKWGKLGWVRFAHSLILRKLTFLQAMPLINIMMDGNSATVDFQLRELFTAMNIPEQYIRYGDTHSLSLFYESECCILLTLHTGSIPR